MIYESGFKKRRVSGNNIQKHGGLAINSDKKQSRGISNVNQFIADMAKDYMKTTEGEHWPSDLLNHLNNQFPTSIQPPKESTHQKTLAYGLQNLNQQMLDVNHYPVVSHGLISSHSALPDLLISPGFHNSDSAMNVGYTCYNSASINISNPGYFGGSSFKDYSQNVASANISCDGMNLISPLDVKQADLELVNSPEQVSSITACSYEDMISDTEAFDSRAALPGIVLHSISGPSAANFYQQQPFHKGQYQSAIGEKQIAYNMNFPTSLLDDVHSFYPNSYSVRQNFQQNPQSAHILPRIYNTHRSTCGTFSQSQVQMSAPHQFHQWAHQQPVQLDDQLKVRSNALSVQMSAPHQFHQWAHQQPVQLDDQLKFRSNGLSVNLEKARKETTVYKIPQLDSRKPVQGQPCVANFCPESRKRKYDTLEPSSNESWIRTGTLADILPPNYLNSSMTVGDQFPQVFSASPSQQGLPVQLPRLEQWPKASVHNEDISEVKTQLLTGSRGSKAKSIITEDSSRNNKRKNLGVACHEQKSKGLEGNSKTTNEEFKEPPELSFCRVHEEKTSNEKEESSQVGPKAGEPQQANRGFDSASDVYDSVLESIQSTALSVSMFDCDLELESEKTKSSVCHEQKSKGLEGNSNTTNEEFKEPPELSFCRVHEEKTSDDKEESSQIGPKSGKPQQENCDFSSASDVYDSVLESIQSTTPSVSTVDCDSVLESEKTKPSVSTSICDEQKSKELEGNSITTNEEFKESPELNFRRVREEKTSDDKEESSQIGAKSGEPQQENCDFSSASDVYDSVLESIQSTTPSVSTVDCDSVLESKTTKPNVSTSVSMDENDSWLGSSNIKTPSASLADSFTASQIKEHLSSFIQHKEISGNTTPSINQDICQLCSMDKLLLAPAPIYCSSCDLRIKQNAGYYRSADEEGTQHCVCMPCFRGSRGANILIRGVSISKANLQKTKNDEEREDSWVMCDRCQHWQHRICGLFNDEENAEYVCPKCFLEEIEDGRRIPLTETSVLGAKDLPRTNLSDHIEQRLFRRMKQEREEMAKFSGIELGKVAGAEGLVVRVVVSVDKQLEVKQQFRDIFHGEDYPQQFAYRSKRLGGVDVCLFGMCVQEFGSDCAGPNHRCVYISYLDSVKYFKPERTTASGESLRTFVYHEILIGYLDYCKKRGFATCYIWACPLIKGEDYIFYCHPETQKTPKQDKLRQWYKLMLRKAAEDDVVVDNANLYNQFFVPSRQGNSKITAARLPYFDGDYWSVAAESIVKKLEEEQISWGPHSRLPTKRTLIAMGQENPDVVTKDFRVMQKLGETIMPLKENFMVVRLQYMCTYCHEVILSGSRWFCNQCNKIHLCSRCFGASKLLSRSGMHTCHSGEKSRLSEDVLSNVPVDTKDEDDVLVNNFFETRDDLLNKCQKSEYQFDTLTHAKYSSMMILYHLMKSDDCHTHKLTQPSTTVISESISKQAQKQTVVMLKVALDALIHASECKSIECSYPGCGIIRKLLHHASICSVKVRNGCKSCQRAWWILKEHAQICKASNCRIPRCMDIRKHRAMLASSSENKSRVSSEGVRFLSTADLLR